MSWGSKTPLEQRVYASESARLTALARSQKAKADPKAKSGAFMGQTTATDLKLPVWDGVGVPWDV